MVLTRYDSLEATALKKQRALAHTYMHTCDDCTAGHTKTSPSHHKLSGDEIFTAVTHSSGYTLLLELLYLQDCLLIVYRKGMWG